MRTTNLRRILGVLAVLAIPLAAAAAPPGNGNGQPIVLNFEPTVMLLSAPNGTHPSASGLGATAWMVINQASGGSDINFFVRGARPNTLYTIWTVFRPLKWCTASDLQLHPGCPSAFPTGDIKPGFTSFPDPPVPPAPGKFYPEGGAVAPTASMAKAFTSGMGLDPGATFDTNDNGDGQVHVKLDYNLLGTTYDDGPPVGNADVVAQCAVPGVPLTYTSATTGPTACPTVTKNGITTTPRFTVTSSWLRKFIIQVSDPATECANYDPTNPGSIFWQCIDPATVDPRNGTGLPRVWRYPFDHFRLAAHPDELTHGFIGGSAFEHAIDFVGRRCMLTNTCP